MSRRRTGLALVSALLVLTLGIAGCSHPRKPAGVPKSRTFDVTAYGGCSANGRVNCYEGIQDAVAAAQSAGGGTVVFPTGTFLFDSKVPVFVAPGNPVTIQGSGRDSTRLRDTTPGRHPTMLSIKTNHVTVDGLTLDSSAIQGGGSVLVSTASYTTVEHCRVLGGPQVAWPLRFAGGGGTATPTHPTYQSGNVVKDLILSDDAPNADDGLDFSFQQEGSITDVQHFGSRLGLYVDKDITVTNYRFTPNPAISDGSFGYYITTPGTDITISDFTTSGAGGVIGWVPRKPSALDTADHTTRAGNSAITIVNERMLSPTATLVIGDVSGLVIRDSQLGKVQIRPSVQAKGSIQGTTYHEMSRAGIADGAAVSIASVNSSQVRTS